MEAGTRQSSRGPWSQPPAGSRPQGASRSVGRGPVCALRLLVLAGPAWEGRGRRSPSARRALSRAPQGGGDAVRALVPGRAAVGGVGGAHTPREAPASLHRSRLIPGGSGWTPPGTYSEGRGRQGRRVAQRRCRARRTRSWRVAGRLGGAGSTAGTEGVGGDGTVAWAGLVGRAEAGGQRSRLPDRRRPGPWPAGDCSWLICPMCPLLREAPYPAGGGSRGRGQHTRWSLGGCRGKECEQNSFLKCAVGQAVPTASCWVGSGWRTRRSVPAVGRGRLPTLGATTP